MQVNLIKDSIANGIRICTFVLVYPRLIHCFDETTEVLSQINDEQPEFRSFKEVAVLSAKVAQYNEGIIEFVYPTNHVENSGSFKMIRSNKKGFPFFSTAGHRVFTLKRTTGNQFLPDTILASDLAAGSFGTRRIPQSGLHKETQIYSNDELSLIVWYVADGHKPTAGTKVQFHFKKQRKIDRVLELLTSLNISYTLATYGENSVIKFDPPAWVSECYTEDGQKILPDSATKMTLEGYQYFKKALLESDGSIANQDYNTTSGLLAQQIQTIAVLHNDSINLQQNTYQNGMYKLSFKGTNYISIRQDKDEFITENFTGTTYCVSVPSSYILVRKSGVVYVSGNCELMTHRVFSRNAASSRAIPTKAIIQNLRDDPAEIVWWGKSMAGMQAKEELSGWQLKLAKFGWATARELAILCARFMNAIGLHKQIANRVLEPFQNIRVVVTSTEWNNFFALRNHPDAQPEFQLLAAMMYSVVSSSIPEVLKPGEWHIPYIHTVTNENGIQEFYLFNPDDQSDLLRSLTVEQALKISASLAAQESYRKSDPSLEKAEMIWEKLVGNAPVHASPTEHQAKAMEKIYRYPNCNNNSNWETGITHVDRANCFFSGNFRGFIQHRQLIPNHHVPG